MSEQYSDQDISLSDFFYSLLAFVHHLLKHWLYLLLVGAVLAAIQGYQNSQIKPMYTATLTFMRADAQSAAGIGSLMGRFGGLLGGAEGENQQEKIMELARSRKIVSQTLFCEQELEGKKDFLANHLIRLRELHKDWARDSLLKDFLFQNRHFERFTRRENSALLALYGIVTQGNSGAAPILSMSAAPETGIITFKASTEKELLSIVFLDSLYGKLSRFYQNSAQESQRAAFELLIQKRDSLARALNRNDAAQARFSDQSGALLFEADKTPKVKYQRNNQILSAAYAEAVKNAELAQYALESQQAFLTSIDLPIAPIKPYKPSKVKAIVVGFFTGALLTAFVLILGKIVLDALARGKAIPATSNREN